MQTKRIYSLTVIALFITLALTGTLTSARPFAKVTAIRCGHLIDGKSDVPIDNAVVLIEGDKITAVGAGLSIPSGADVIDLSKATVLPGFIDCHTHVLLQGDVTNQEYDDQLLKDSNAFRAIRATVAARTALNNGFTGLRDLETEGAGYADVDVKRAINQGIIEGPRMAVATRALSVTGGYGLSGYSWELKVPKGVQIVDGADEARKAVREQIDNGADWIKVYADRSYFLKPDGSLDSIPTFTLDEMKAIVDEAHRLKHKVAAHAMAPIGIHNALTAGVDSIEHGIAIDDEAIKTMVARGVYYCPTLMVTDFVAEGRAAEGRKIWAEIPRFHHASFERAVKAGVPIAFGTDAGGYPWTMNEAKEFAFMVKFGMTPMQAIKSATSNASNMLGWQDQVGTIQQGKFADLVAVEGNPLTDIKILEQVKFVMKGGQVVKNQLGK